MLVTIAPAMGAKITASGMRGGVAAGSSGET